MVKKRKAYGILVRKLERTMFVYKTWTQVGEY
jgi:hypothetical protein